MNEFFRLKIKMVKFIEMVLFGLQRKTIEIKIND